MVDLSLSGLGVPAVLLGAVMVLTIATLLLHALFPAAKTRPMRRGASSSQARLCPACRRKLTKTERNGLQIEICPSCEGVWLSKTILDQIMR